jgi:hypothetical protein
MKRHDVHEATVLVALVLLAVVREPDSGVSAQTDKVPVVSLKAFLSEPEWQLDITWTAKDKFENADFSANLEMTATARLILKQSDKQNDASGVWGRWHVEKSQSDNLSLSGVLVNKHNHSRTEYRSTGRPALDAGATFDVGGQTPGYQLTCGAAFPVKLTTPLIGTIDSLVTLLTTDIEGPVPVFATGPLPPRGTTIHGSLVIPMTVPPFGPDPVPLTRVGVQFVLQPTVTLAPLVPIKKP